MNHEHLKQHLPFIVEMIESVKTVEFRQKWQIMKELIESNKLTVKQIETIELNIKKAKELKEQYKKTIVFTSLPNIDTKNDKETTKTENVAVETAQNTQKTSAKAEINELKIKKQMKELRRLHENIVKDEIPLPSKRRSALKRSYRDSLEMLLDKSDDFPNLKKRKSETEIEKKTAKDDSFVAEEGTKSSSKIARKSLEAPKSSKIVAERRKSLGNPRTIKKAPKLVENNPDTNDLIETPIPITKSTGKITKKPIDPAEASKPAQIKRKSLEISKPPPEKRKLKEVPEVAKQKRKSIEIAKPAQEQQKPTLIEEKKVPQKTKKPEEVKQKVPKSIEVTKSEPIILKISKSPAQEVPKPIVASKSKQEVNDSLDVSKIVKRKSKIPKPVQESPKKIVETTKPVKQVAKSIDLPVPANKEEHPKPLEIKKSSMNKLRKKIEKHQKKEVLKKKSRATLLTKGAAIKKGSKIDDDEWEDVDDSDNSEDEEELDSAGEEEIEKIMEQIHNVSNKEDVQVESAAIKKDEAPITMKEDEQKPEPIKNPIIIKKVQNMSYISCKKGFIFKCLVQNCKFQTMDSPAFVDHIENEHLTIKWLGHCDICVDKVDTTRSIIFELMHMRENHVLKEVSNADDLPDITEHSEPEIVKKQEFNESSKVTKPEDEIKNDSKLAAKPVELKSIEKVALVGKKIDIGKIKLIPYKGTPLSPKSPEIGINKSIDSNKLDTTKPAVIPAVEKDIQPDASKAINSSIVETDKKQQEVPDGKQKIIKHIIVKPPQDKEASTLIVKPKQPNVPPQKAEPVSTKPQTLSAEQKIVIQRQKSTDSQKDMSSADLLRPWLKRKVKKYLMPTTRFLNNVAAIIATYKCMSSKCSFYTSDRDLFNSHLRFHETHQTGDRDYMNCSYCDHIFNDKDQVIALVEHIETEHCFDKYQCKYCFYRSCVSLNVINHQHIYHAMKPKSVYELACDKNRDYEQELATVKKSRLKCVPPLSCVKCNAKFYLFPKLSAHMLTHGPNIKTKCTKCSKVSDLSNIHTHFINCHNLGLYQCVFCVFGSNNFDVIINHIGNCHPSKPPIYCERSSEKTDEVNPASIESTSLKFLTQQVDHRIIETSKINQDMLRNEKNVGDLGGNFKLYPTKTKSPNKEPQPVKKVPEAKLGSALKKVETKMAGATELVKEIETIKKKTQKAQGISNEKSTGLQIKSVFSLNKF